MKYKPGDYVVFTGYSILFYIKIISCHNSNYTTSILTVIDCPVTDMCVSYDSSLLDNSHKFRLATKAEILLFIK